MALVNRLTNRFTGALAHGLRGAGHEVVVVEPDEALGDINGRMDAAAAEADLALTMWADASLARLTRMQGGPRVVTFLRSFEALEPGVMDAVVWSRVSGIVFVAKHVQAFANRAFPHLRGVAQTVIHDAVNLAEFPVRPIRSRGTELGYLGYLNSKKGIPLLLQCLAAAVRVDPRYRLHVAGVAQEPRVAEYFRHIVSVAGLADHLVLHGFVDDVSGFLQKIDVLLNTSPWEACPNAVIEAMAAGVKPLVHHWPGAADLFPPECLFITVDDFVQRLTAESYDSAAYRNLAAQRFSLDVQIPQLDAFLNEVYSSPTSAARECSVTLCMLAGAQSDGAQRQLAARLGPALESARPWVDEVVVIDTGCGPEARTALDAFADRCAADGHPKVRVERRDWEADFALHRNQSLDLATGDWILILDSDEEIDQEFGPVLRELAQIPSVTGALYADLHNVVRGGETHLLHARLFRRGQVRYTQRVHNIPHVQGGIAKSALRIRHHGYSEVGDVAVARTARRIEMCECWVADEPENSTAWTYLAYARLETRATVETALEAAERAVELHLAQGRPANRLPHAAFPLMSAAMTLGLTDDVLRAAQLCVDADPLYPDPYLFAGYVFAKLGRWQEAFNAAGRFLELQARARIKPESFVGYENMTYSRTEEALRLLGTAMVHLEQESLGGRQVGA